MRSYFWKFVLCLLPCVLAAWVTVDAVLKYQQGFSGGFKLGVDLVGGTILVYEIDVRKTKTQSSEADTERTADAVRNIQVLADALKKRIDPNDLYNIIIRPAGGEGRIEIILPTGGTHRTEAAEAKWRAIVKSITDEAKVDEIKVGRGRSLELADRIQALKSESIWEKKLFGDANGWNRLLQSARDYWPVLNEMLDSSKKDAYYPELEEKWKALAPGDLRGLSNTIMFGLAKINETGSEKVIQTWVRQQAWEEMMERARQKWTSLAGSKAEMDRIPADQIEQLTTFIQADGSVVAQAGLTILNNLLGKDTVARVKSSEVREFVAENYGPAAPEIVAKIQERLDEGGLSRDLTVEEVQRIKDLVAKVGKLEFRILANQFDDAEAIDRAKKLINTEDQTRLDELAENQKKGLPPPAPTEKFTVQLAKGQKSVVTYAWAELGPQERRSLNLDNAARNDPNRNMTWLEAAQYRNKAAQFGERSGFGGSDRFLLHGALFYSRKCEDRNIPEEERRKKDIEYFVLTREPEFIEGTDIRTPAITGDFLAGAYGAPGPDLSPTVHFNFNLEGSKLFGTITGKNVSEGSGPESAQKSRHLAIILDGQVMSAPTIQSRIDQSGTITGRFTQKEVDSLVNILRAGRLPATLKPQPVSESTIGATLGEDTINAGVNAILMAFIAVLAFMCVYYRFAGVVASIALLANLLLTVGFMVFVQATFTLPGLAGIVLMLGMAVDANVLIYERLREERERGASLAQAIRNGYDHALPTIIDTHLSSIFTAIVLYVVGNDQLKGFGVSLTVGLLISLFTSLYMTRTIFDYFMDRGWLRNLNMMRLFARPNINFMSIRYQMFIITLITAVLGVALFIARLPNDLNIDFTGGTAYSGQLAKAVDIGELRQMVDADQQQKLLSGVEVRPVPGSGGLRYDVRYSPTQSWRTISLTDAPSVRTKSSEELAKLSEADRKTEDDRVAVERAAIVRELAMKLPDPSVELTYPSFEEASKDGKSRYFTIRTSEKAVELVQTVIDQLLRQGNEELLKRTYVRSGPMVNRDVRLYFYNVDPPADFNPARDDEKFAQQSLGEKETKGGVGSPTFVKTLLTRELRRAFGLTDKDSLPFSIDLTGEGFSTPDGKYHILKVNFSNELRDEASLAKVQAAIERTRDAFSSRPQPERLENFDSQLAQDTQFRAMWAIIASWAAVLVYLWFRFGNWTFGMAAVVCLVHDLFLTLGAIAACHYIHGTVFGNLLAVEDFKVDLPAIAALLTLVGYSVNDTIVVFDRIREVRGKNPDLSAKMINDSINQTLSRTVLASLTTWLVVMVLYIWGGPGVKLFAFVMVVGVIIGTYSSIYIASPLLLMFGEGRREETNFERLNPPNPTAITAGR